MAFQVGTVCYATAVQAAQVAASQQAGSTLIEGGRTYFVNVGPVTATSISYVLTSVDKSITYTSVQPYTAQPCASENNISDQISLFYLMLMLMIPIWGGKLLYNFFNRGPNE